MKNSLKNKMMLLLLMLAPAYVMYSSGGSGGGGEAARSTGSEYETVEIRTATERLRRAARNGTLDDRIALFTEFAPQCNPLLKFERGANLLESTMRAGCIYDKITRLLVQRIVDMPTIFKKQTIEFLTDLKEQIEQEKMTRKSKLLLTQIKKALSDLDGLAADSNTAVRRNLNEHEKSFLTAVGGRNRSVRSDLASLLTNIIDFNFESNRGNTSLELAVNNCPIDVISQILSANKAVSKKDKKYLFSKTFLMLTEARKVAVKNGQTQRLQKILDLLCNDPYQRFDIPVQAVPVAAVSSAAGFSAVAPQPVVAVKPLKGLTSKRKSSSSSGPVIVKAVVASRVVVNATNQDKGNHAAAAAALPAPVVVVQAPNIVAGLDFVDDLQDTPLSQEQERLLDAIISQNIEEIKTIFKEFPLFDLNFKTEFTDQSPLSLAAAIIRSSSIVKVLLEHGKNILASDKTELLDRINAQRFAASGTAVQAGNVQVIEQLLLDSNKGFVYTSTPQNRRLFIQAGGSEPAGQSAESASATSLSSADFSGGGGGSGGGGSVKSRLVDCHYVSQTAGVAVAPQKDNKEHEKKREKRSATTKKSYCEISSDDDDELSEESSYHDSDASDESSDSSL